jgi:hypothetical protein
MSVMTMTDIRIELEEECLTFYISDEDLDALPEGEDIPTSDMKICRGLLEPGGANHDGDED